MFIPLINNNLYLQIIVPVIIILKINYLTLWFVIGGTQLWLIQRRRTLRWSFGNTISSEPVKHTRKLTFPKSSLTRPSHHRCFRKASTLSPIFTSQSSLSGMGTGQSWWRPTTVGFTSVSSYLTSSLPEENHLMMVAVNNEPYMPPLRSLLTSTLLPGSNLNFWTMITLTMCIFCSVQQLY